MTRRILVGLAVIGALACGGGTEPTPIGSAVNGVWKGSTGSIAVSVDIHSLGESGVILGSGTMTAPGASRSFNIQGAYVAPTSDISLEFIDVGFDVFFTGTLTGGTMGGALQGSAAGFNGQPLTLTKQ